MPIIFKKILQFVVVPALALGWIFSGQLPLWQYPRIPPRVNQAYAASATYCFNSYNTEMWDSTPTNAVNCSTSNGTNDNNNGHYIQMDANEYTSGGSGTISKVEARVYYKNNWTSGQQTRSNVPQLQPYFGGTSAGDTHNDATGNHSTLGWSATFDITNDTNAPSTWTWSDIAALDMRVTDYRPNSGQITVYRVEITVTYTSNSVPTLSISQPDGTDDTVSAGDPYDITYTLADSDDTVTTAFYYDTDNTGLDGTAISGACATAAEGTDSTCSWDTTGVSPGSYYIYGITNDGTNPQVSAYSPGQITINSASVYSVSITSSGSIEYGFVDLNTSSSTEGNGYTQTAQNDGTVTEKLNIKSSDATGGTGWTLASSGGSNVFVHEFSTTTGATWTIMPDSATYVTADPSVAQDGTVDFDFRVTTPTDSDYQEKSITITVQAVAP